jgi:hypothetical protein
MQTESCSQHRPLLQVRKITGRLKETLKEHRTESRETLYKVNMIA